MPPVFITYLSKWERKKKRERMHFHLSYRDSVHFTGWKHMGNSYKVIDWGWINIFKLILLWKLPKENLILSNTGHKTFRPDRCFMNMGRYESLTWKILASLPAMAARY